MIDARKMCRTAAIRNPFQFRSEANCVESFFAMSGLIPMCVSGERATPPSESQFLLSRQRGIPRRTKCILDNDIIERKSREDIELTERSENPGATAQLAVEKRAITNRGVLNEAYAYAKPSSFSRGMRIDFNGVTFLFISGTASIDEHGNSVHIGDFRAQMRRTPANITGLLASEDCTWHDVVRTTCCLRDIDREYDAFNEERTAFYEEQGLDPLPASTGIQAIHCRPELLIEIEAIAMCRTEK